MAGKRRVFGAAFKAKVALAAANGDRTTAQLASQFGIHTSQVTAWKKQPTAEQVAELERRGGLETAEPPEVRLDGDTLVVTFPLPRAGVSLLEW